VANISKNPATVVSDLLGVRAIARALHLSPGAVSKWKESGLVPSKHHEDILALADDRKVKLTAEMLVYGDRA